MENAVTFAITDALFQAFAGTGVPLLGTSIDRRSITGNREAVDVKKPLADRFIQKTRLEYLKEALCGSKSPVAVQVQTFPEDHKRSLFQQELLFRPCVLASLVFLFADEPD